MLTEKHFFEFRTVPSYSFELTVHKPAGLGWSTPNEVFETNMASAQNATCFLR